MPIVSAICRIKWSLILCSMLISICFFVSACGSGETKDIDGSKSPGTVISETEDELTIVDQANRQVTVKKDPQSIALCYRVVIRFLLSLDQGDKIKGIGKSEEFLEELQPSLKNCADVGKGVADIEALAELKPDLFVHKASDLETLESVDKIGIPSIGIDVETPDQMMTALDILGKVCGAEEKATKLKEYYDGQLEELQERTSGLQEKDRPKALVMGTSIGKVADSTMLQGRMLELAGGKNCAEDIEATELWPTAGVEQIFSWDPEYIFITGSESAVYSVDDLYRDPAWSEISAVKNRNVYIMPTERDSWEFPGVVSVLGAEYMMSVMHPEIFTDKELDEQVEKFYELSYGRTFDREELGY